MALQLVSDHAGPSYQAAEWRRAFKALPAGRQMLVATILFLYRGEADKLWLVAEHLARGRCCRRASGANALRDWGRLVALYPGW